MANFRTTADYVTSILQLSGEVTNGNSSYLSKAIEHLNSIHKTIIMGGNEFNVEVDEVWSWANAKRPFYIELVPAVEGTATYTQGSEAITFSSAPTDDTASNVSLQDWYVQLGDNTTIYRINNHTSGATSAELDNHVVQASATGDFKAFKLIYKLESSHIQIQPNVNDRIYFAETTAKTMITSSITVGSYTPSELATEIQTQMNADGSSVYTVLYNSDTKKFTISSDGAGGDNVFYLISENALNISGIRKRSILPTIGFGLQDLLGTTVSGNTSRVESDNIFGAVARLSQPVKLHVDSANSRKYSDITLLDPIEFDREYPTYEARESTPTVFKVSDHTVEGEMTIQLNHYPQARRLLEVPYVPMPVPLYNNNASYPLIPQTESKVLEYGAAAWLLYEKNDDKWQGYYKLAGERLQAMMTAKRRTEERVGRNFGEVIAREDLLPRRRTRLTYGYTGDN